MLSDFRRVSLSPYRICCARRVEVEMHQHRQRSNFIAVVTKGQNGRLTTEAGLPGLVSLGTRPTSSAVTIANFWNWATLWP